MLMEALDNLRFARERCIQQLATARERVVKAQGEADEAEQEIKALDTSIRVLQRLGAERLLATLPAPDRSGEATNEENKLPRGYVRKYIEDALRAKYPLGASVGDIREYIQHRWRTDVNPNTVSVTLSRLKSDGIARLEGQDWHHVPDRPELAEEERRAEAAEQVDFEEL